MSIACGENYKKEKDFLEMRTAESGGWGTFEKGVPNSNDLEVCCRS